MIEMSDKNETTYDIQENANLVDRLPKLDEDEMKWSEAPGQKSWAYNNLRLGKGFVWHMDDNGLVMQVTSEDTMRLLTVVEHEYCFKMVSYIKATLDCLGLNLDLSQAIIRPYVERADETVSDDTRMESEAMTVEVV